jgi:hypothetical protein
VPAKKEKKNVIFYCAEWGEEKRNPEGKTLYTSFYFG